MGQVAQWAPFFLPGGPDKMGQDQKTFGGTLLIEVPFFIRVLGHPILSFLVASVYSLESGP